jgi:hypothetical protein
MLLNRLNKIRKLFSPEATNFVPSLIDVITPESNKNQLKRMSIGLGGGDETTAFSS